MLDSSLSFGPFELRTLALAPLAGHAGFGGCGRNSSRWVLALLNRMLDIAAYKRIGHGMRVFVRDEDATGH